MAFVHNDIFFKIKMPWKKYMNAICRKTIQKSGFDWIDDHDFVFIELFKESIKYIESKKRTTSNLFDAMSQEPENKEKIKEHAQFYTPPDVALYSAYQLLKNFNDDSVVFDPCTGKGSLLIAVGAVLAIKFNLRDEELLSKMYGCEICEETYSATIDNIIYGLGEWIQGVDLKKAKNILINNIKNENFYDCTLPKNSLVIVNPPYKEVKEKGNTWIPFIEKIVNNKNVKSFTGILPVSLCSADRTFELRKMILKNFREIVALHHDTRPRPLFKNIEQRITIITTHKGREKCSYDTTGFLTHKAGDRIKIWRHDFTTLDCSYCKNIFPKISSTDDLIFFNHHFGSGKTIADYISKNADTEIWIRTTGRYKLLAKLEKPENITTKWKKITIEKDGAKKIIEIFQNGDALRWWKIFGDGRDISVPKLLNNYKVS